MLVFRVSLARVAHLRAEKHEPKGAIDHARQRNIVDDKGEGVADSGRVRADGLLLALFSCNACATCMSIGSCSLIRAVVMRA